MLTVLKKKKKNLFKKEVPAQGNRKNLVVVNMSLV